MDCLRRQLKQAFQQLILTKDPDSKGLIQKSNEYLTIKSLKYRLLKGILYELEISKMELKSFLNDKTMYIHPQISHYLSQHFPAEEEDIFQKIYSADNHTFQSMILFIDTLEKKSLNNQKLKNCLNMVFAVDGLNPAGNELSSYRYRLSIPFKKFKDDISWDIVIYNECIDEHVRTVRYLYNTYIDSEKIKKGILCVLKNETLQDSEVSQIITDYKNHMGIENIMQYKKVTDFDKILALNNRKIFNNFVTLE